jgi:hypothetical protein
MADWSGRCCLSWCHVGSAMGCGVVTASSGLAVRGGNCEPDCGCHLNLLVLGSLSELSRIIMKRMERHRFMLVCKGLTANGECGVALVQSCSRPLGTWCNANSVSPTHNGGV